MASCLASFLLNDCFEIIEFYMFVVLFQQGVQYFDSGDYYTKTSKEEKKEVATHPALFAVRAQKKKSVGQPPSKLC